MKIKYPKNRRSKRYIPIKERFWNGVKKTDNCWEWIKAKDRFGYGYIKAGGKDRRMLKVHRVSYILNFGEIPKGMCVLHRCDNPSCVNPEHLSLGTQSDNVADCHNKGRRIYQKPNYRGTH